MLMAEFKKAEFRMKEVVRKIPLGTGLLVAFLLSVPGLGGAAQIKGVSFSDEVVVDGLALEIQGVAVLRWGLFFDVYAGALYLPAVQQERGWEEDVAKRLELCYFRPIDAEDFSRTSKKLIKRNLSQEAYRSLEGRLETFCSWFKDVKRGDRYSITYLPGSGTALQLNGQFLGAVPGADFASAYFGIWLGPSPISEDFRDRLIGNVSSRP